MRSLVLPGEVPAQPQICVALRTAVSGAPAHHAAPEYEEPTGLVHVRRRRTPNRPTNVYEVFPGAGPFLEPGVCPLRGEFLRRHLRPPERDAAHGPGRATLG